MKGRYHGSEKVSKRLIKLLLLYGSWEATVTVSLSLERNVPRPKIISVVRTASKIVIGPRTI